MNVVSTRQQLMNETSLYLETQKLTTENETTTQNLTIIFNATFALHLPIKNIHCSAYL